MKFWRSRRGTAVLGLLLLAALFGIRPGANRLRARIVDSISQALGRQVEVASVHLRLLPRPGFDLENFVVHDRPRFGAEPLLRAGEVTASLRIAPLFRGRLEIARLGLSQPSLNLVRNAEGRWNLEDLLVHTAQTAAAPTGKTKPENRPVFPYIEADHGRINLKFGAEKKPYALTEARFALWQDSENAWGVRLKAQPVRTDFNLSDTGTVELSGLWQRAVTLRDTPLQFNLQWNNAQLGQVTKLTYGGDKGWRGGLKISVVLMGTPANLGIDAQASVDDFRRYDVLGGGALRLAAHCSGAYSVIRQALSNVSCRASVGDGLVTLKGGMVYPAGSRSYDLLITADDMPMQSLAAFARHAKQGIPDDLLTAGTLNASVRIRRSATGARSVWSGSGEASGFRLTSELTNTDFVLGKVPFLFSSQGSIASTSPRARIPIAAPSETHVAVGPVDLAFGKSSLAVLRGWISVSGYRMAIQGDAALPRLFRLARTVGIPAPQPAAEGWAKVDLQIAGGWTGFAAPTVTGKAQLHSVRAEVRGFNAPLEIASANVNLTQDRIQVQNVLASLAGTSWRGSLAMPRPCTQPAACPIAFDLHADEISIGRLNQALNPHAHKRPWYHFLYPAVATGSPYLLAVNARGKLSAGRLLIQSLAAGRVSAQAELKQGKLQLSDLRADFLDGKHVGEWRADFTARPPQYSGSGSMEGVAFNQVAKAMQDEWITGVANVSYRLAASGFDAAELLSSASSTLLVDLRDGLLPHIALEGSTGPLKVRRLRARLVFQDGQFNFQDGLLETPVGSYEVSGTASLGRNLDLKLNRDGSPVFNITGTLTEPHVSPVVSAEAQAALKP